MHTPENLFLSIRNRSETNKLCPEIDISSAGVKDVPSWMQSNMALLESIPHPCFPRDDPDAWEGLTAEERGLLRQHRAKGHAAATAATPSRAGSSNDPPLHMQDSLTRSQLDRLTLAQKVERYGAYEPPGAHSHKHRQRFFKQRNNVTKPQIKPEK